MPDTFVNKTFNQFIQLKSVDSTNNYAMQQVKTGGVKHGFACFAYEQTAGKGQQNKRWLTKPGENIILSVVLEINNITINDIFLLNVIAALSAIDLFNKCSTKEFKIKWPNDIYWRDKKAGGILIETVVRGNELKYAIIGFGLNINQTTFDQSLPNPISLKQVHDKDFDVVALSRELSTLLIKKYDALQSGGQQKLIQQYNDHLYKKNEQATFKKNGAVFNATVCSVRKSGELILHHATEEAFTFGSVEWIIKT